jgi:hypothetical protein
MKILRSVLFVFAVLLLAAAAQAQQTNVRANIPFNFYAGDHMYAAGEYWLTSSFNNDAIVHIGGIEQAPGENLMSNTCRNTAGANETKLVFRRVGENYFLYQVWLAGNLDGREFFKPRAETLLAKNHEKSEIVIIAANITK